MSLWITTLSPLARPVENIRVVSAAGAIGTIGEPGSARAANLPSRDRTRPPGRPWSVWGAGRRRARAPAAPRTGTAPGPAAATSISAPIEEPFIATSAPSGATSGIDHASSRSRGATAREVTTSKVRSPCRSSARPRSTSTDPSPRSATTSSRKVVRRSSGSTRVTRRSGRAMASTSPGSPAPEPEVADDRALGDRVGEHRAVEQVPLPQPGHLARTDQAAHGSRVGQPAGVRLGQRQPRG